MFQWENDIECSQLRSRGVNYVRLAGSLVAKVVANSTLTQAECYPGTSNSEQQTLSLNPFRNPFAGATEVVAGSDGGREGEAPTAPTSTTTYSIVYVHTDALGSPVAETNINATVISGSRTQYEPYGKPLTTPREGAPSYTGHQHDTSTGLIYAQQRYYDPQLGRFLATDPVAVDMGSAGNWNRYAYANNSPYRFTDPDGREAGCITLGTSCGFGTVTQAEFNSRVSTAADFTPVVGDIKGIVEAVQNPSAVNVIAAGVGLVPILGDAAAKVIKGADKVAGALHGASPKINPGQQGKHQIGHNNHTPGRSVLTADPAALGRHAGTGQQVGKTEVGLPGSKERVNFGEEIGTYVDQAGAATPTTNGIIHYGSNGIHIVPARPDAN